jgi:hypothetical protein|tara:strand:- start:2062 stop:2316 length:255 start_codon:yes stop_codon:yes gene_type:complete
MFKEIKYLFYIISIFFFIFFSLKYYFSDNNKKIYFRSINEIDNKIKINEKNLFVLDSDTDNIIEYVDGNLDEKTKKYKFWELLK